MGVGRGAWEGQGTPWILKISEKKVVLLVSRGKKQISQFPPPRKILRKSFSSPPGKNFFRRPCVQREFYSRKVLVFGKLALFDFCWTAEC